VNRRICNCAKVWRVVTALMALAGNSVSMAQTAENIAPNAPTNSVAGGLLGHLVAQSLDAEGTAPVILENRPVNGPFFTRVRFPKVKIFFTCFLPLLEPPCPLTLKTT